MTLLGDEFEIDGYKLDPVVTQRVNAARLVGRDKGAMSLELTIWDGDWRLRREGKLTRSSAPKKGPFKQASWARYGESRLILDGLLFRLAAVDAPLGSPLVRITWDDESPALMRRHSRAIVVSRGSKTRAQVIGMGTDVVKEIAIPYRCPEEKIRQNVEAPDDTSERKGLTKSDHITVKTVAANREQLKNMEIALGVADQLLAGERATLAALVAGITESQFVNLAGGDADSQGVLQVQLRTAANITPRSIIPGIGDIPGVAPATLVPGIGAIAEDATGRIAPGNLNPRDVKEVFRVFFLTGYTTGVGAIKYAADHPDAEIYEIAQAIQGSGAGRPTNGEANYGPWVSEAEKILAAWGGVGQTTVLRERKQFQLGGKLDPDDKKPENYWAGANRLAEEVDGWNLWAWRNQVNFVSDEWLFKRKPVFTIGPENVIPALRAADSLTPFVKIGHRADVGSTVAEITIETVSRRWDGAPGSTVLIDDLGEITGKWLISENDFDLQRDIATLRLRRPVEKAPEPATSTRKVTTSAGPDASGDIAYPLAEKGTLIGTPGVGTHAWGQNWQSSNAVDIGVPVGTTVYATEDGVISPPGTQFSGFGDGGAGRFAGKRLHLKADGSTRAWFYTHLSQYEPGIKPGARVRKGDVLGKSGSANGVAHLHIGVGPSRSFNPQKLLGWSK